MPDNCDTFKKISALSALFIAGATLWGFLITYFQEVGIFKYYRISTRFIKLDVQIFAMSWRGMAILAGVLLLCYLFYEILNDAIKRNPEIKIKIENVIIHYIFLLIIVVSFLGFGYCYLMKSISAWGMVAHSTRLLLILIYYCWISDSHPNLRIFTILLIIVVLYIGGIESSYSKGYNVAKTKDEYYIINGDPTRVVILENNEFILWSNYYECSRILDSTINITYFSSDTSINLRQVKLGPIKRRNDAR